MFDLIIIAYNISNAEKTDAVFLIELLWHCKGEMAIEKKKSPLSESQIKRMDRVGKGVQRPTGSRNMRDL